MKMRHASSHSKGTINTADMDKAAPAVLINLHASPFTCMLGVQGVNEAGKR